LQNRSPGVIRSGHSPVTDRQLSLLDLPGVAELEDCIRCGLCLSVCPTYRPTRVETKSPRGRIALVKNMVEGGLALDDPNFAHHMDLCLQCMACHSVCPTDVSAGEIVARAKSYLRATSNSSLLARLARNLVYKQLLPSHAKMEAAALPLQLYSRSGLQWLARSSGLLRFLPERARLMEALLPSRISRPLRKCLPETTPAIGDQRAEVVFHLTCVNNVMLAGASEASVRVLAHNGCSVHMAPGAGCCGAPHETAGEMVAARELARRNIAAYEAFGESMVISDAAACGAVMKNYGHWLQGDPVWAERAKRFSARVQDFHQYLVELGPVMPRGEIRRKVTYADPCHLCHAQGIGRQPRSLLKLIPGLQYVELRDATWCCGSAGTYNIEQPAMAETILAEKMDRIRETGARVVTSANPGCLMQIEAGARRYGVPVRVQQVSQLLEESYRKGARSRERKSKT
jgi:glycolate oxidase iron-sulfur subunit